MAGITAYQREIGWNIRILDSHTMGRFAGFYQQADFATVADIRRELDLCFELQDDTCRLALVPIDGGPIVSLKKDDPAAFPTPPPGQRATYHFVSHDPSCDGSIEHSLASTCIRPAERPRQRKDPRYLPIGRLDDNPLFKTVPLRGRKRRRTSSTSASRSQSPTKGSDDPIGYDDVFPEVSIPADEAHPVINEFRQSVISGGDSRCVISRQGSAWWNSGIGPAIQAVHIVPQTHWNVHPRHDQSVTPTDDVAGLREAWERTWHPTNGLLLMSHLHQCFDARLLSIDPTTHRIRAFMPYDVITGYHGAKAHLPEDVSYDALQHHYDMCCIENMAAKKQIGASLRGKPAVTLAMQPSTGGPAAGDPAKKNLPLADGPGDQQGGGIPGGSCLPSLTEQVATPPSSDRELGQEMYRLGSMYFTDPQEAQRLREAGLNVIIVDSEESELDNSSDDLGSSSEEERGRPRKRRSDIIRVDSDDPCSSSEEEHGRPRKRRCEISRN
ncbi:hypothetical protein F5883DRAFT_499800 [Diaporthe sp. PMI_573]|nr:hypothetical protein F5883DRAFT_499800 [Diaporthaceae sp. PMI_573]